MTSVYTYSIQIYNRLQIYYLTCIKQVGPTPAPRIIIYVSLFCFTIHHIPTSNSPYRALTALACTGMDIRAPECPSGLESTSLDVHMRCFVFFHPTSLMTNDAGKLVSKRQMGQLSGRVYAIVR